MFCTAVIFMDLCTRLAENGRSPKIQTQNCPRQGRCDGITAIGEGDAIGETAVCFSPVIPDCIAPTALAGLDGFYFDLSVRVVGYGRFPATCWIETRQVSKAGCGPHHAETTWLFGASFSTRSPESKMVFPSGSLINAKYIPKEVS